MAETMRAMAGLGNLPDTILSRSVIIRMRRRGPNEVVESYRRRLHAHEGHALRDRLATWAESILETIDTFPAMPEGITDRPADVWESLLSVADAAGGPWPDLGRVAAVALVAAAQEGPPSLGVRLLTDCRKVFIDRQVDVLPTAELLNSLTLIDEAPWSDLRGKPIDARRLANLLNPYGIKSKVVRIGASTPRGYAKTDFFDAWLRYLPPMDGVEGAAASSGVGATSATGTTDQSGVVDDDR